MSRTRIISQSKAVYASPSVALPTINGTTGYKPVQLHRVDSLSFDVDIAGARQDIREFGQLARIGVMRASEITPTLSLGYYLTDGENEKKLGFNIKGTDANGSSAISQMISGILTEVADEKEKNIYVLTVKEGEDAFGSNATTFNNKRGEHFTIAFGNATPTSYTANFSVGEIPRADVEFDCGNLMFISGSTGKNPAVDRTTAASLAGAFVLPVPNTGTSSIDVLKAGDVTLNFATTSLNIGGVNFGNIHAQSASVEIPLSRESIEKLGSELPYAKPLEFPINATLSVNAIVDQYATGTLQNILTGCSIGAGVDVTLKVTDRCGGTDNEIVFLLKDAVLDSQNFSLGLDDNETVDLTFSTQIAGVSTTGAGVFCYGAYTGVGSAVTGSYGSFS